MVNDDATYYEVWKEAYDKAIEVVNAWRQHAQARTGGEIASALVRLNEVMELKYLVSQREGR